MKLQVKAYTSTWSRINPKDVHEEVMKFLERQRERERDSGGVEAVVGRVFGNNAHVANLQHTSEHVVETTAKEMAVVIGFVLHDTGRRSGAYRRQIFFSTCGSNCQPGN